MKQGHPDHQGEGGKNRPVENQSQKLVKRKRPDAIGVTGCEVQKVEIGDIRGHPFHQAGKRHMKGSDPKKLNQLVPHQKKEGKKENIHALGKKEGKEERQGGKKGQGDNIKND